MSKNQIVLIIVLLIILGLSYLFDSGNGTIPETEDKPSEKPIFESIEVYYDFENGIHEYSGILDLPTPCHELEIESIVRESYPEQVTIEFDILNHSEMCAQVITETPFRVIFQASERALVNATINGTSTNLIIKEENDSE